MKIKNKAALITGAASGLGAATARLLASLGAKVALFDMNENGLKTLAEEISAPYFLCDVTEESSVLSSIEKAVEQIGNPRICINCAGIVHSRRMINQSGLMPLAEFKRVIDVNLIGSFNFMQLAAAKMIPTEPLTESLERGVIINTASVAAFEGQIGQTAYSASKGGIVSLTLPVARELAQFGIRVMTIAPGLVDTPMFDKIPTEAKQSLANQVPFPKRLAQPAEFAQLVKHIIENEMLNGSVIRLDGALRLPPK